MAVCKIVHTYIHILVHGENETVKNLMRISVQLRISHANIDYKCDHLKLDVGGAVITNVNMFIKSLKTVLLHFLIFSTIYICLSKSAKELCYGFAI